MKYDFKQIEPKWQQKWDETGAFRAEDFSTKPKYYNLVEFPYPSGHGMHVGHIKAYSGHQNQIDYILCSQRWRSCIQSAKTRPGADCDSDHELLIAKFRLKLKKVGKTTRPFDDLNQIPCD